MITSVGVPRHGLRAETTSVARSATDFGDLCVLVKARTGKRRETTHQVRRDSRIAIVELLLVAAFIASTVLDTTEAAIGSLSGVEEVLLVVVDIVASIATDFILGRRSRVVGGGLRLVAGCANVIKEARAKAAQASALVRDRFAGCVLPTS